MIEDCKYKNSLRLRQANLKELQKRLERPDYLPSQMEYLKRHIKEVEADIEYYLTWWPCELQL